MLIKNESNVNKLKIFTNLIVQTKDYVFNFNSLSHKKALNFSSQGFFQIFKSSLFMVKLFVNYKFIFPTLNRHLGVSYASYTF